MIFSITLYHYGPLVSLLNTMETDYLAIENCFSEWTACATEACKTLGPNGTPRAGLSVLRGKYWAKYCHHCIKQKAKKNVKAISGDAVEALYEEVCFISNFSLFILTLRIEKSSDGEDFEESSEERLPQGAH